MAMTGRLYVATKSWRGGGEVVLVGVGDIGGREACAIDAPPQHHHTTQVGRSVRKPVSQSARTLKSVRAVPVMPESL